MSPIQHELKLMRIRQTHDDWLTGLPLALSDAVIEVGLERYISAETDEMARQSLITDELEFLLERQGKIHLEIQDLESEHFACQRDLEQLNMQLSDLRVAEMYS